MIFFSQTSLTHCTSSASLFFHLSKVSYIPPEVFTRPGEEVTVYSVFHNRSWNASRAVWMLNGQEIPESQYKVVNERVSAVTIRSKQPGFDTLMCCLRGERYKCSLAYAMVYKEGKLLLCFVKGLLYYSYLYYLSFCPNCKSYKWKES